MHDFISITKLLHSHDGVVGIEDIDIWKKEMRNENENRKFYKHKGAKNGKEFSSTTWEEDKTIRNIPAISEQTFRV